MAQNTPDASTVWAARCASATDGNVAGAFGEKLVVGTPLDRSGELEDIARSPSSLHRGIPIG
jgi:hypothetical protein